MKSFRSNKASGGEALIVSVVVAGFFWIMSKGEFEPGDFWSYVGFLVMIVAFYFALLLCRMIFFHMIGGTGQYPWWATHEERMQELHVSKKGKKSGKK